MKYTVTMRMSREAIMEIRHILMDVHLSNSWGMVSPLTFDEMKGIEQLNVDIGNWLLEKRERTGMDMVMLDHAIDALEGMYKKFYYTELEALRAYKQITFLKEKFLSIRKLFCMDRSC